MRHNLWTVNSLQGQYYISMETTDPAGNSVLPSTAFNGVNMQIKINSNRRTSYCYLSCAVQIVNKPIMTFRKLMTLLQTVHAQHILTDTRPQTIVFVKNQIHSDMCLGSLIWKHQ